GSLKRFLPSYPGNILSQNLLYHALQAPGRNLFIFHDKNPHRFRLMMFGLCLRTGKVSSDGAGFHGEPVRLRQVFFFYGDGRDPAAFHGMGFQPPSPAVSFLQSSADIFQTQPARLRMVFFRFAVVEEGEMNGSIILASAQDENARVLAGISMRNAVLDQGMEYHGRNAFSGRDTLLPQGELLIVPQAHDLQVQTAYPDFIGD